jgi:transcriptional regulator with XRE-family HTH domain
LAWADHKASGERLERLRRRNAAGEPIESDRQFAKRCGIGQGALRRYLDGLGLPSFETLSRMSEKLNKASLDWLLLGDGDTGPRFRLQSRAPAALEADVAAFIGRRLTAATADGTIPQPTAPLGRLAKGRDWVVSGGAVLEAAAEREIANARELVHGLSFLRDADRALLDAQATVKTLSTGGHLSPEEVRRFEQTVVSLLHQLREAQGRQLTEAPLTVYPPVGT